MEYKTLKNITAIPQSVVFKGRQHVLMPLEEQNFEETVAHQFLTICGGAVLDTTDDAGSAYTLPSEANKYMWLANMTGNPDAPAKVVSQQYDEHGRLKPVEVDNPLRILRDLRWEIKGGHEQWIGEDGGMWQRSLDNTPVGLPAKRRIRIERTTGEQILARDGRGAIVKGAVIASREPANFEPSMQWELDDIRAYMRLIDPSTNPELDEATLTKRASERGENAKDLINKAKQELLHRLYFRLVDPKYRLPTRAEFQEFVTGKPSNEVAREEVEKLLEQSDKDSKRGLRKLNA